MNSNLPLIVLLLSCTVHADLITVDPASHQLLDSDGRQRFFHGVNVVEKAFPYHPSTGSFDYRTSFVEEDAQLLHQWGANVVRLGVMWAGVEPQRGQYNETYLSVLQEMVSLMAKYNIYVVLDCHQDLFSEKFCGDGAPAWAAQSPQVKGFPFPLSEPYPIDNTTGFPSPSDCNKFAWGDYYVTEATSVAFQNLYDNYDGLQDSFANFWVKVAQTFKDSPNVIGYELLNEPWAGDIYSNPKLLLPGVADINNLAPMYDNLNAQIRKVDPDRMVLFEPVTWDDIGTGFQEVPGGADYRNRSALSYHFYIPPDIDAWESMIVRWNDIDRLQCGGFMTEYGLGTDRETKELQDAADFFLQSWIIWEYKEFIQAMTGWTWGAWYPNGTIKEQFVYGMGRTYAFAVSGSTQDMFFNDEANTFELKYTINPQCTLPTEIYLNEQLRYLNGFTVTILPSSAATWKQPETNYIQIIHSTTEALQLTVLIAPKETM